METTYSETRVPHKQVKDLHFDASNPRLVEFGVTSKSTDEEILKILWREMDVAELVLSMVASGYFSNEPLIATEEKSGGLVVIEGNRRLAALKVLTDPTIPAENNWKIPEIGERERNALMAVPVIIQEREESWRYLGFKHVNGPAKWSSFAKAQYITNVHRNYKVKLEDIARQIGDGHGTVQKLYRGLMVLEQAEREKVYDREDRYTPRIFFSHLYTGLEYPGFSEFLQLQPKESEKDSPVPKEKLEDLGEVLSWLYGNKKTQQQPVVKSQNPDLKYLNAVVAKPDAIQALRAGDSLVKAYQRSRPTGAVLQESLLEAKRNLQTAKSYLDGYDKSEDLQRTAGSVMILAQSIYDEMERLRMGERERKVLNDL